MFKKIHKALATEITSRFKEKKSTYGTLCVGFEVSILWAICLCPWPCSMSKVFVSSSVRLLIKLLLILAQGWKLKKKGYLLPFFLVGLGHLEFQQTQESQNYPKSEKSKRNKVPCWLQELTLLKHQTASYLRPIRLLLTSVNDVFTERNRGPDNSLLAPV